MDELLNEALPLDEDMALVSAWAPPARASIEVPVAAVVRRGLSRRSERRAMEYMEQHLGDHFTLAQLAQAACVSRAHFARLFHISRGMPPMTYLMHLRIERAKTMLIEQDLHICEVAAMLGFCDQSHFSRSFRRATGMTPREHVYRHRM